MRGRFTPPRARLFVFISASRIISMSRRKGQLFVVSVVFLVGMIFVVQQVLFNYSAVDMSSAFEIYDTEVFSNIYSVINKTAVETYYCNETKDSLAQNLETLKASFLEEYGKEYSIEILYVLNCSRWNNVLPAPAPLSLTLSVNGQSRDTRGTFQLYHTGSSAASSYNPSNLILSQVTRSRSFTVSWTAGTGNGGASGCKLQFYTGSGWSDITSAANVNCDADSASAPFTLNGDGWKPNWNGTQVRLLRKSDSSTMGVSPAPLSCVNVPGSATPTPTIDEDCDGYWDNSTCSFCSYYQKKWCMDNQFWSSNDSTCTGSVTPCGGASPGYSLYQNLAFCEADAKKCWGVYTRIECVNNYGYWSCDAGVLPVTSCEETSGVNCGVCGETYY
jgi:hypothetical protein